MEMEEFAGLDSSIISVHYASAVAGYGGMLGLGGLDGFADLTCH